MESFLRNGVLQINYINLQFVFSKKNLSLWNLHDSFYGISLVFTLERKLQKEELEEKLGLKRKENEVKIMKLTFCLF